MVLKIACVRRVTITLFLILFSSLAPRAVFAQAPALDPALRGAKYLDSTVPIEDRVDDLFARLTMVEKASLLHGTGAETIGNLPRIGLWDFRSSDGPQGINAWQKDKKLKATMFPPGIAMAASWDPALVADMGAAMGEETLAVGSRLQLGPAMTILRSPLGGRTFEYMGEDPLLAGKIAAGVVHGLQSRGVSSCIKHVTGNEQEHWRGTINTVVSERALREIYARPFEVCIKESHPWSLMAAYNRLNGQYCCQNQHLLVDLLRTDWKWDGMVLSDWGAWHGTTPSVTAGADWEMPGFINPAKDRQVVNLVEKGAIPQDMFDSAVRTNLRWLFRVGAFNPPQKGSINTPEHQEVARRLAAGSIVLLKNDDALLPLDAGKIKTIAVIGPAADWKFSGVDESKSGGSGAVPPPHEITALAGIREKLGDRVKVIYSPGFNYTYAYSYGNFGDAKNLVANTDQISQATQAAASADVALVFVGTNHAYDHEGFDKPDLDLIGPAAELIKAVTAANPKTVVVLTNGAPVSVEDWIDRTPALVEAWYPGMEGGHAIADVLFGDVNPSGKLPCTFGKKLTDWKCMDMGPAVWPGTGNGGVVKYDDGIWVGYRHFDHDGIEPRFPFGFGLSYTTFKLEDPTVRREPDGTFTAQAKITNTGNRDGAQVVQVYMSPPKGEVDRPIRELTGFQKIFLKQGESQIASIIFGPDSLRYWSEEKNGWVVVPGTYTFGIGTSSRDLPLTASLDVK